MSGLVEEYFERDLTEAEEQRLSEWLESSEEGPQRLIALMEAHYRKLGVPEPEWGGGPLPSFFPKPRRTFRWLLGALLVLALSGYFAHRWSVQTSGLSTPIPSATPRDLSRKAFKTKPQTNPARGKARPEASSPPGNPERSFREELSVVVDNPKPGLVTVKVVDPKGRQVRFLYAGILPAGQRTFTWDGKGEKGLVVPSGVYYLEVTSGSRVLRREVRLDARP